MNKPSGGIDVPPPPPPQPDYPSPPPNAITFTNNGSQIPVYYNQTVVLQCLTSGVVSPVLIIRKVDHATIVVGGGLQEGSKGVPDSYCPPGEVCGDPVSQLHKIAFEVYDAAKSVAPPSGSPGTTGSFLSCMGEKVNTYRPVEGRSWTSPPNSSPGSHPPSLPDSPLISTPSSATAINGATEYFARLPPSPTGADFPPSSDGGRVKRGKRNSVSSTTGPITKMPKGRRRQNSQSSVSSGRAGSNSSDAGASSGAVWQVDIGETSVWTIVGTGASPACAPGGDADGVFFFVCADQVRYNFYVPPVLFDVPPLSGGTAHSFPIPSKPVTPIPGVVKYLMPDRAAEAPKPTCAAARAALTQKPDPRAARQLTVYGENFSKADPVAVFFGAEPSPHVDIRCTEVSARLERGRARADVCGAGADVSAARGTRAEAGADPARPGRRCRVPLYNSIPVMSPPLACCLLYAACCTPVSRPAPCPVLPCAVLSCSRVLVSCMSSGISKKIICVVFISRAGVVTLRKDDWRCLLSDVNTPRPCPVACFRRVCSCVCLEVSPKPKNYDSPKTFLFCSTSWVVT